MNIYLILFTLPFASARITSLITSEAGPFGVFIRLRYIFGYVYRDLKLDRELTLQEVLDAHLDDELENYLTVKTNQWSELVTCNYCTSIWVSLFFVVLYSLTIFNLRFTETILFWLANSFIAIKLIEWGDNA